MLNVFRLFLASVCLFALAAFAQEPPSAASQPLQRITGVITAVDQNAHTISVKEDKTGTVYTVELQNTKSLRKVDPATLDLKKAIRITADDLMAGDRVQVFALKAEDNPNAVAGRAVILISARDLQTMHQEQSAAWQHSTGGVVTQIDAAGGKVSISARTPQGPKPMTVDTAKAQFTRYSPTNPKTPAASQLADVQVGDQLRVIGETSADGSTLTAQKVYSSPIRTLLCTVSAVSPDGKAITVKDLRTKQSVTIALNDDSAVRKLPPMMAMGLARRLNPAAAGATANGGQRSASGTTGSQAGAKQGEATLAPNGVLKGGPGAAPPGNLPGGPGATGGGFHAGGGMRNGDVSQLIERLPKISATDLKAGDAVVVTGAPIDNDRSRLLATNVIAGVEPIFQSASPRQMQSLGDWGLASGGEDGTDGASPQ
jgi:Cu/Ag efflux protein CusF